MVRAASDAILSHSGPFGTLPRVAPLANGSSAAQQETLGCTSRRDAHQCTARPDPMGPIAPALRK